MHKKSHVIILHYDRNVNSKAQTMQRYEIKITRIEKHSTVRFVYAESLPDAISTAKHFGARFQESDFDETETEVVAEEAN